MGAQGQGIVDFGAFPGTDQATLVVTGQTSILSGSLVEAWLDPTAADTADHSSDEHLIAEVDVRCSAIVAGTGFTITASIRSSELYYGQWNVAWVWN